MLKRALKLEGYDVITAVDGTEVLTLLGERRLVLVILGIVTLELNGVQVPEPSEAYYALQIYSWKEEPHHPAALWVRSTGLVNFIPIILGGLCFDVCFLVFLG